MRKLAWLAVLCVLAACGGNENKEGFTKLTLKDPAWEKVNVQIVITKSADCDNRGTGYISGEQIVMQKDTVHEVQVPDGAAACWRHDRDPKHPVAGDWSGWTRAQLNAGYPTKTDL
ncbi:MAG TPA: hypothetical protein VFW46_01640 [Stellaceae bacterium]|nr:hypothetical protein [Stellaceae bacterium]